MDFIRAMNYGQGVNGALEKFAVNAMGGRFIPQGAPNASFKNISFGTAMPKGSAATGSALGGTRGAPLAPGAPGGPPAPGGVKGFFGGIGDKVNGFLSKPGGQFAAQAGMMVGIPLLMNAMANRDQR